VWKRGGLVGKINLAHTRAHAEGLGSATMVPVLPKTENKTKAGMNHHAATLLYSTPHSEPDGLTR